MMLLFKILFSQTKGEVVTVEVGFTPTKVDVRGVNASTLVLVVLAAQSNEAKAVGLYRCQHVIGSISTDNYTLKRVPKT